ncbi:hypothetical protein TNCV_3433401 [Trichonephila clavipes]|nr:hypothetical protein TNCV_3433401 [Trichonephila clavipes]
MDEYLLLAVIQRLERPAMFPDLNSSGHAWEVWTLHYTSKISPSNHRRAQEGLGNFIHTLELKPLSSERCTSDAVKQERIGIRDEQSALKEFQEEEEGELYGQGIAD